MATDATDIQWLAIVETQQQELEDLRALLEAGGDAAEDRPSSAFTLSSVSSSRSSRSSIRSRASNQIIPLDLQRYAKVCGDAEQLQHKLTTAEIQIRQLRASETSAAQEMESYRELLQQSGERVRLLEQQLASEQQAKNEAIERVVQALFVNETLTGRLTDTTAQVDKLQSTIHELHSRIDSMPRNQHHFETREAHLRCEVGKLEALLHSEQQEVRRLGEELFHERTTRAQHVCVSVREQELEVRAVELQRIIHLQTTQLERQQQALLDLDDRYQQLVEHSESERLHHQEQQSQQMEAIRVLQSLVDHTTNDAFHLRETLAQSEERGSMHLEEMAAYARWRWTSVRRDARREEEYTELLGSKAKLEKDLRQSESSRRRLISELAEARRQLDQVRAAMHQVDAELQRMTKTFSSFRTREANVTRALREYGRRNRILQDAVQLMRTKVLLLSDSLKRSEKRKALAAEAAHELKRGLVIERCQRQDLLIQCAELEQCLHAFQKVACESADRATIIEKENAVLQHAVKQLCAYSTELSRSQQALQQELEQLEVHGRKELNVFG